MSVVEVLCNRYGTGLVKNVRKLEKIDYKYRKLPLDLDFLQTCQHSNVIPNLAELKVSKTKKLINLVLENSNFISETLHDPEKIVFNFSGHELSDDKKSLLCKGLNFAIPPKRVDYTDHVLPFELLFRNINKN